MAKIRRTLRVSDVFLNGLPKIDAINLYIFKTLACYIYAYTRSLFIRDKVFFMNL